MPKEITSVLLQHAKSNSSVIKEEAESVERKGEKVTIEHDKFDERIVSQHPSQDSESMAQQTQIGRVSAKILSDGGGTAAALPSELELASRAESLGTEKTNEVVPGSRKKKSPAQMRLPHSFLIGSTAVQE